MTDELQYQQEIGRKLEDTRGTDPIVNGSETFEQFGLYNRSFGNFPQLTTDLAKSITGASYDPNSFSVSKTSVGGNTVSTVTDGLGFFYALCRKESSGGAEDGGVVDDGSNQYTLTPITSGDLASYTTRFHSINLDTANIQKSIPLCQTVQHTLSLDNTTPEKLPLAQTESFAGKIVQAVAASTDDYTLDTADSLNTMFFWDHTAGSLFTWDTESANVELRNTLRSMSFTINNASRFMYISGQHYANWNVTGNRVMILTAEFERRNETSIFDDYLSQSGTNPVPADDFKNATFKISNANSKFIQLGMTDIGMVELVMNHAFREGDQIPTYQLKAEVRNVAPVIKDGTTSLPLWGISA